MNIRWYQKVLSMLLTLALLIQLLPVHALAASISTDDDVTSTTVEDALSSTVTVIGEETTLRTETEKHFRLSDGSFVAVSYGMPVHYQDDNGQWQDIDNTLSLSEDQDTYLSANDQVSTTFSADLSSGRVMTSTYDGTSVAMSLLSSGSVQSGHQTLTAQGQQLQTDTLQTLDTTTQAVLVSDAEISDISVPEGDGAAWSAEDLIPDTLRSSVLYEDVYPGVDLLYTAYSYNIKEQIIVKDPQTAYRYDFLLELDGVSAVLNEDHSVSLIDSDGNVDYTIPAPYMEDSNGVTSSAVTYTLTQVSGGIVLTVEADADWINDEDRAFPVTIDPTLEVDAGTSDDDIYATYVIEGTPDSTQTTYQHLYFGYGYSEDVKEQQIFMHFNRLPSVPVGASVIDARLSMYMFRISYHSCTDLGAGIYEVTTEKPAAYTSYRDWIGQLSWNTKPSYDNTNMIDHAVLDGDPVDAPLHRYYDWDMTELVQKWYDEGTENRTVAMAITPGSSSYGPTYCSVPGFMAYGDTYPPLLVISYRVNTGIEDHYTYATLGAGAAGNAYIADSSGQLMAVKELVTYSSTISPFSLSLVYNSVFYTSPYSRIYYPFTQVSQSMPMGRGWTLDVQQWVAFETIGDTRYIKYCDGDGTIHYFSQNPDDPEDETYYDEDGLGLTITLDTEPEHYIMSDPQGNTQYFTHGILTETQDNNGNQYLYHYSSGQLISIGQKNDGASSETTVASFSYTGDFLTSVTDAAGRVHSLNYTNGLLTSISLGDTTIAEYTYNNGLASMKDSESGYSVHFMVDPQGRVIDYAEFDRSLNQGARVSITYDSLGKTTYRDYGNDRQAGTSDDIYTHFLFDYSGRTVNAYSTDANSNILGASTAAYHDGSAIDRRNDRTIRTASIGVAAEQELLNSGFESTASAYAWSVSDYVTISTESPRTGSYSFRAYPPNSVTHVWASKASQCLYAGQTYTLSAYVKTTQMSKADSIYLMVTDGAGSSWKSDEFAYQTSQLVDDGWMRISVTFTARLTGAHTVSVNCLGGIGRFYVDDLQLESGAAPSNRNLLENGNMQAGTYGWTLTGAHPTASNGMFRVDGVLRALSIPGSPVKEAASISQEVPIGLSGVSSYVLSGWAKGNAVPDNVDTAEDYAQDKVKTFGLRATVNYSDGTKEYFYAPFDPEVSDWQFTSLTIMPSDPTKTVSTITAACVYEKNANTAHFDNISLVREVVQTLSYDMDGNLVSAETTGQTAATNTYENGNLVETVTGTGSTYSYTYDQTHDHRLLSYTDGSTTQSMTYDSYGNVDSTTFRANEGDGRSLVTYSSYNGNGNRQSSSTDTNGVTTGYVYSTAISQMLGQPTRVIESNGAYTHLTYDDHGRTTQINVADQAALEYNYGNGELTDITRYGSRADQEYSMDYDPFGNLVNFNIYATPYVTCRYGNSNGLLEKQTYANGDAITYTYDVLGRMTTAAHDDGRVVSYVYNGDGQLHSVQETGGDSPATYLYTYDTLGNLIASEKKDRTGATILRVYQSYDTSGQLVGQSWYAGRNGYSESYTYNTTDGSLATVTTATGETVQLGYDDLQRLTSVGMGLYTRSYTYRNQSDTKTTEQVSQVQYTGLPTTLSYGYTYDARGNIATYTAPGKGTISYTYDVQNQLLSAVGDESYTYTYDTGGNILTANGHTYTYGNSVWVDLLTAYDGETITYDRIGNPLSYYNGTRWTFTWENGRSLATATDGTTSVSYAYDAGGLRTSKTVGDVTHSYLYASGQLLRETYSGMTFDFFYDSNGHAYALKHNGITYYYITNLQGDVMYMVDAQGNTVASYEYDPYGGIVSATGAMAQINPLRYRGYYYDAELGMYYLQSRYYDPVVGRFINADDVSMLGASDAVLGYNLFAYCENNPINNRDKNGYVVTPANVIGAMIAGIVGAVGGYYLSRWLAGKIGLKGWKRTAFIGGLTAVITAAAAVIGYFIGPYVQKAGKSVIKALRLLAQSECFVAGTLILSKEGKVPIEQIDVGDYVYAENPETGEKGLKKVLQTFVNETSELVHLYVNNEVVTTTFEHPFYVDGKGWTGAGKLKEGDILILSNGGKVVVDAIVYEYLVTPILVYNFEVDDFHTYYVGETGILVHNICAREFAKTPKKFKDVAKYLEQNGFRQVRQNGSHVIFEDIATGKTFPVPNHGPKEIAIGTLRKILKLAGLWK